MAKRKRTFRCDTCKSRRFKNALMLARHFKKHPSHRNHRQERQFKYSQRVRDERGRSRKGLFGKTVTTLPTVRVDLRKRSGSRMKVVRVMKFCTDCGSTRKATHRYCGGCGGRLG